jgi:hypothetical protein
MDILSIGKTIQHDTINITTISESELSSHPDIGRYDYIIINGGDGTIRRVFKYLHMLDDLPPFILNPTGSFNVVAKLHKVPTIEKVLVQLEKNSKLPTQSQQIYSLNKEVFLFSAGNMGDLQHIFLSETLRFGLLQKGIAKYILAVIFLFPVHLIMTPFMLISKKRFFIFTPLSLIKKFGSFYGKVEEMQIDLKNRYNLIELDGDIVTIEESILNIKPQKSVDIVIRGET